jgi:hypothetical protein
MLLINIMQHLTLLFKICSIELSRWFSLLTVIHRLDMLPSVLILEKFIVVAFAPFSRTWLVAVNLSSLEQLFVGVAMRAG